MSIMESPNKKKKNEHHSQHVDDFPHASLLSPFPLSPFQANTPGSLTNILNEVGMTPFLGMTPSLNDAVQNMPSSRDWTPSIRDTAPFPDNFEFHLMSPQTNKSKGKGGGKKNYSGVAINNSLNSPLFGDFSDTMDQPILDLEAQSHLMKNKQALANRIQSSSLLDHQATTASSSSKILKPKATVDSIPFDSKKSLQQNNNMNHNSNNDRLGQGSHSSDPKTVLTFFNHAQNSSLSNPTIMTEFSLPDKQQLLPLSVSQQGNPPNGGKDGSGSDEDDYQYGSKHRDPYDDLEAKDVFSQSSAENSGIAAITAAAAAAAEILSATTAGAPMGDKVNSAKSNISHPKKQRLKTLRDDGEGLNSPPATPQKTPGKVYPANTMVGIGGMNNLNHNFGVMGQLSTISGSLSHLSNSNSNSNHSNNIYMLGNSNSNSNISYPGAIPMGSNSNSILSVEDKNSLAITQAEILQMSFARAAQQRADDSKLTTCNCKKSKCLKMYCDCFRLTEYCKTSCNCFECNNLSQYDDLRRQSIKGITDRNPEAFKPRVLEDPAVKDGKGHLTGCHCRKSACLKKYCECFTGHVPCGTRCRCIECKNVPELYAVDESVRRQALTMAQSSMSSAMKAENQSLFKAATYPNSAAKTPTNPNVNAVGSSSSNKQSAMRLFDHHNPHSSHLGSTSDPSNLTAASSSSLLYSTSSNSASLQSSSAENTNLSHPSNQVIGMLRTPPVNSLNSHIGSATGEKLSILTNLHLNSNGKGHGNGNTNNLARASTSPLVGRYNSMTSPELRNISQTVASGLNNSSLDRDDSGMNDSRETTPSSPLKSAISIMTQAGGNEALLSPIKLLELASVCSERQEQEELLELVTGNGSGSASGNASTSGNHS